MGCKVGNYGEGETEGKRKKRKKRTRGGCYARQRKDERGDPDRARAHRCRSRLFYRVRDTAPGPREAGGTNDRRKRREEGSEIACR